jgi:hypothetical protein
MRDACPKHVRRLQVLKAANLKMTAFWDIEQCSLVEVYRRFRGAYCLNHHRRRPNNEGSKQL